MVRRWNLAEVEGDGVASLCLWDLCEFRCLCEIVPPFLAAPPHPYMGGQGLEICSKSVTGVYKP
jgi:hypothetical protein